MSALSKPQLKSQPVKPSSGKAKAASASEKKRTPRNAHFKPEPISVRREFSSLDEDAFLREHEAAEVINITAQSLKRLRLNIDPVRRAKGPPVTLVAGKIRYRVGTLRAWIAALPTTSTTP